MTAALIFNIAITAWLTRYNNFERCWIFGSFAGGQGGSKPTVVSQQSLWNCYTVGKQPRPCTQLMQQTNKLSYDRAYPRPRTLGPRRPCWNDQSCDPESPNPTPALPEHQSNPTLCEHQSNPTQLNPTLAKHQSNPTIQPTRQPLTECAGWL